MAYATVAELRQILTQVKAGAAEDALMEIILDRATEIADLALTFSFADWPEYGGATERDIRAIGGQYLWPKCYQPTTLTKIEAVYSRGRATETTTEVEDWICEESELPYSVYRDAGWIRGQWYRLTAVWGYGPAPESIKQVTLEVAVNLWGSRDSRQISDVIGVEGGGAVGYQRALTNRQKLILDSVKLKYQGVGL